MHLSALESAFVVTPLGVVAGGIKQHPLTKPFMALSKQRFLLPTTAKGRSCERGHYKL